jgi:hypothetical protein
VNGQLPLKFLLNQEDSPELTNEGGILKSHDDYIDKVYKADYVGLQTTFMNDLTSLASTLKTITDKNLDVQS